MLNVQHSAFKSCYPFCYHYCPFLSCTSSLPCLFLSFNRNKATAFLPKNKSRLLTKKPSRQLNCSFVRKIYATGCHSGFLRKSRVRPFSFASQAFACFAMFSFAFVAPNSCKTPPIFFPIVRTTHSVLYPSSFPCEKEKVF